jgi:uncharacterized membrane protein YgcG
MPDVDECAECLLSYPRASSLLGVAPWLPAWVADTTHTLGDAAQTRLKRRLDDMQQRFPELVPQIVMHRFPDEHPFTLHVFWLFNAADFAGIIRRGNRNHALLLAVDPGRHEAAIMPGYGLEDILTEELLGRILDAAAPLFRQSQWVDGMIQVFDEIDTLLEGAARSLDEVVASPGEF